MTTTFGLTSTGFLVPKLSDILTDLQTALQNEFGASINVGSTSILGQITAILAERYTTLWQLAQAVNASQDPDQATGAALDALCSITGTLRPQATSSTVTLTLTGIPATSVPIGNLFETASTQQEFALTGTSPWTIAALPAWAQSTPYVAQQQVTANGNVYQCATAGTSSNTGTGPSATNAIPGTIADGGGTLTWYYIGTGTGAVNATAQSVSTGPIQGFAGDITVIINRPSGLQGVNNVITAVPGTNTATDAQLRQLRLEELATGGVGTAAAIQAALLETVFGGEQTVSSALVYNNITDSTDPVTGAPPHSVLALVQSIGTITPGADNLAIATKLYNSVAAGIPTTSGTAGTPVSEVITDSQGFTHTINFARPTNIRVFVTMSVTYNPATFPTNGATQIVDAVVAYAQGYSVGFNVVAAALGAQAFTVTGVLDVPRSGSEGGTLIMEQWQPSTAYTTTTRVYNGGNTYTCTTGGTSASSGGPTGGGVGIVDGSCIWNFVGAGAQPSQDSTIPISVFQLATIAAADIVVNATPGTP